MFGSDDSSGFPQSDVMVLAEDTAQVASGEKDGTGTGSTGDTGLLPIMQRGSGSHNICRLASILNEHFSKINPKLLLSETINN